MQLQQPLVVMDPKGYRRRVAEHADGLKAWQGLSPALQTQQQPGILEAPEGSTMARFNEEIPHSPLQRGPLTHLGGCASCRHGGPANPHASAQRRAVYARPGHGGDGAWSRTATRWTPARPRKLISTLVPLRCMPSTTRQRESDPAFPPRAITCGRSGPGWCGPNRQWSGAVGAPSACRHRCAEKDPPEPNSPP